MEEDVKGLVVVTRKRLQYAMLQVIKKKKALREKNHLTIKAWLKNHKEKWRNTIQSQKLCKLYRKDLLHFPMAKEE